MQIQFEFECDPDQLEFILALATPFLGKVTYQRPWVALPEALLALGTWLDQNSDSVYTTDTWNDASLELVTTFMENMVAFQDRLHFNTVKWEESFTDQVFQLDYDETLDSDKTLIGLIQIVVKQISRRRSDEDQMLVYTWNGLPLSFAEWADRILDGSVTVGQVERAHWHLIDPQRLIQLLSDWREKQDRNL